MQRWLKLMPFACVLLSGCINDTSKDWNYDNMGNLSGQTASTSAVVIGMENSQFAGNCPGAIVDSSRMYTLLSQYASNIVLLQDSNATRAHVKNAIESSITRSGDGLFILYYSGHGGSEPFPDTGIEETDGRDEYLCLYDGYMRDNEIWGMISKSKGRVLIIADCCHSKTIYQVPRFTMSQVVPFIATDNAMGGIAMQCWSGCPDDTYSYGTAAGGQFTNALLRHYEATLTYEALWKKIESDPTLKNFEHVQRTIMGRDFSDILVFF